ncbi:HEAT repeat domain-containing protein [Streptomyces pseudovenezuelae]|uniref:HEAT repeat protein n=1 Tax=Streptomyces pseudovenezuelae TaxID=67350 RepID=A0ABT6LSC6_9ACTN|nr:HEAT repeat domain-containing protein [Streptomyces pseudovenezuelae]MDH6219213.1 HEAT repeat protein [Streptomyces pseudovenezuelae]
MFSGIDEVDWAAMRHAYGSAEDVPGLLRGLASADPAEREIALDAMYGGVHHQGDVYDSTLACIPFLFELVESEAVQERGGIVELLVSIGQEGETRAGITNGAYAMACTSVRAGAEVFARLTGDRDAGVRRTAAVALVRFHDEPARVLGLLRERITVERDDRVLLALAESLGIFARRHPGHAADAVDLLAAQSAPPFGPGLRLAALGQLAGCAPDRLPADLVPTVVRLLRDRSERPPCRSEEPDRPDTDTLIGKLRKLRPSDEEGSQLLRTLHNALDGRVADRIALLAGQLSSPSVADRCNAVWMSSGLLRGWRADYRELVTLIGAQLDTPEDRLREAAESFLGDLFALAAPAADHLHALVVSRPELRVRQWEHGAPTVGEAVKSLARTGDPRAVPVLAEMLAAPVVPDELGNLIVHLGPAAAPLAPELRRRLSAVPVDAHQTYDRAAPLLHALTALRDTRCVPEVLRLLLGMPDELRARDVVVKTAVEALGAFGPAAHEAIPTLRGLLDTESAIDAAAALWLVEGDSSAVLPVLRRELADARGFRSRAAAEALGLLGPTARAALPELYGMTGSDDFRERLDGACAVWRIGGDPDVAVPVLRAAWAQDPDTRCAIAACAADLGPAGAPLHDLLRAELAERRRHQDPTARYSSEVYQDEQLLRICRGALEGG